MCILSFHPACSRTDAEVPLGGVVLSGYRGLIEGPEGSYTPELDAEALPRVRYRGPPRPELRASLVVGRERFPLGVGGSEVRGAEVLVRLEAPVGPVPIGPAILEVGGTQLPVVWSRSPAEMTELAEARRLRQAGQLAEADAEFTRLAAELDPATRFVALIERAGARGQGGTTQDVAGAYLAAADAAREARRPSAMTRAWRAAAYTHHARRRFSEVEPLLAEAEKVDRRTGNSVGLVRATLYRGLTLQAQGRYRQAFAALEAGMQLARADGLDADLALLLKTQAPLLQDMGAHSRALEVQAQAEPLFASASKRDRAEFLIDRGWVLTRAMAARALPVAWQVPRSFLNDALTLVRELRDPIQEVNVLANLLWVAVLEADRERQAALLRDIETVSGGTGGFADLFVRGVRAELDLEAGHLAAAETAYRDLLARADAEALDIPSEDRARALVGLATLARKRGRAAEARATYDRAISELERLARETEFITGRARFWVDRETVLAGAIELELDAGRVARAFHIAERARTLALRTLEQPLRINRLSPAARAEWERRRSAYTELRAAYEVARRDAELRSGDGAASFETQRASRRTAISLAFAAAYVHLEESSPELTPPAAELGDVMKALGPGEVLWTPMVLAGRPLSFIVTASGATAAWSDVLPSTAIQAASHIYIAAHEAGGPQALMQHSVGNKSLIEHASVSVLPHATILVRPASQAAGRALVVADPDGSLPHARREAEAVVSAVGDALALFGPAAGRGAVLAAIDGASLFHFSGHGGLHPSSPWEAHLSLARDERLSLEDVLIARPRVARVVLSGCETGVAAALGGYESIGLPEAFLLSGAETVIATSATVDDAGARRFVERLYRAGVHRDAVTAFQTAVRASIADGDDAWKSFYVMGRKR